MEPSNSSNAEGSRHWTTIEEPSSPRVGRNAASTPSPILAGLSSPRHLLIARCDSQKIFLILMRRGI